MESGLDLGYFGGSFGGGGEFLVYLGRIIRKGLRLGYEILEGIPLFLAMAAVRDLL